MSRPENVEVYILLSDGRTTAKESFYNMIFQQIDEVLPAVESEVLYEAEDLCGTDFWKRLGDDYSLAGKCVAHMARTGKLPLRIQDCEHKYPRRYMKE